jgi:DNA-binding NarL/FixJ family response regulator
MPPVSVTMQARNELPDAPAVLVAAADVAAELGLDALAAGALDVLLPHAASSRLVAAAAAVAINAVVCLTVSSRPDCRSPGVTGLPPKPRLPEM